VSLAPLVDDAATDEVRTTQYYEMWGSRAIYHDGWKAVTDHVNQQHRGERELTAGSSDFDRDQWSLYDLRADFSEVHDLATAEPERLRALVDAWWVEAGRNGVLPLDDGIVDRFVHIDFRWLHGRPRYELLPGTALHEEAGPALFGTDFALTASFASPLGSTDEGLICEQGDWTNGWAWFVAGGAVTWVLNFVGASTHRVRAALPQGVDALGFSLRRRAEGGAVGSMYAGQELLIETEIPVDMPFRWNPNGAFLTVGYGSGFPVCDDYTLPFPFTGSLDRIVIAVGDATPPNPRLPNPRLPNPMDRLDTVIRHQ
jgi:arylsulfatase